MRESNKLSVVKIPSLKARVGLFRFMIPVKRAFLLSFCRKKGSMAVEGSLVLPLFLFLMMTLLLTLEAVRFQANVQEALHQVGNDLAFRGYQGSELSRAGEDADGQVKEYLDRQLFPYLCVDGGRDGIRIETLRTEEGGLRIQAEYGIRPFIPSLPIGKVVIIDCFAGHQWIGYRGGGFAGGAGQEEIYVYVTETGTRYHLNADCTYLRIPVTMISSADLEDCRNQSGGRYYPCQRCRPGSSQTVYITSDGTSFHSQADCPSLKRTVYRIPLSEAGAYSPCSKCS